MEKLDFNPIQAANAQEPLTPEIAKARLEQLNRAVSENPEILNRKDIRDSIDHCINAMQKENEPKNLLPVIKERWDILQNQKKVKNVSLLLQSTLQQKTPAPIKAASSPPITKQMPSPIKAAPPALILKTAKNEVRAGGSISIRIGTLVEGGMDPKRINEQIERCKANPNDQSQHPDIALDSPYVQVTDSGDLSVKLPSSFSEEYRRNLQETLGVEIKTISIRSPRNNKLYSGEFIIPQRQIKDFLVTKLQLDPDIFLHLKAVNPQIKISDQRFEHQAIAAPQTLKISTEPTVDIPITDCLSNLDEAKAQELVRKGQIGDFILVKSGQNAFKLIFKKHPEDIVLESTEVNGVRTKEFLVNDVKTFIGLLFELQASTWSDKPESRELTKYFVLRMPIAPDKVQTNLSIAQQLNYHQKLELLQAMGKSFSMHIEYMGKFIMATNGRGFDFDEMFAFVDTIKDPKVRRECLDNLIKIQTYAYGHALGINTKVRIGSDLVPTEGGWGDESMSFISETNTRYIPATKILNEDQKAKLMEMSVKSVEYSQTLAYKKSLKLAEMALNDLKNGVPVSFNTGWHRHAVNVTISNDFLIYTNRGQQAFESLDPNNVKTRVYKIGKKPITAEMIARLMPTFNKYSAAEVQAEMTYKDSAKAKKDTMVKDWDLKLVAELPKSKQKVGNCSFANNKAGVQAGAFILAYEGSKGNEKERIAFATKKSTDLFKIIELEDRAHKFDQWCALEPRVHNDECGLTAESHFNAIRKMTSKMSTGKKFQKYLDVEGETSQKASVNQLQNRLNTFLHQCRYKLEDCSSRGDNIQEAEYFMRDVTAPGSFLLFENGDFNDHEGKYIPNLSIFIKTGPHSFQTKVVRLIRNVDGTYNRLIPDPAGKGYDRTRKDSKNYRTLGELVNDVPEMKIPVDFPKDRNY